MTEEFRQVAAAGGKYEVSRDQAIKTALNLTKQAEDVKARRPAHASLARGNDVKLTEWITATHAAALPHLHSFANGLELDRSAVDAGLTLPYHNGRTEGVNTRTKRIMRQMHGRAGFDLLRHRILLH
jgi:transposase